MTTVESVIPRKTWQRRGGRPSNAVRASKDASAIAALKVQPLDSRLELLRYQAADVAQTIIGQIRAILAECKKRGNLGAKRNELRQLATTFGILYDKVDRAGEMMGSGNFRLPQQVLAQLKVGIAVVISDNRASTTTPQSTITAEVQSITSP